MIGEVEVAVEVEVEVEVVLFHVHQSVRNVLLPSTMNFCFFVVNKKHFQLFNHSLFFTDLLLVLVQNLLQDRNLQGNRSNPLFLSLKSKLAHSF